jgi:hypothetical protein
VQGILTGSSRYAAALAFQGFIPAELMHSLH